MLHNVVTHLPLMGNVIFVAGTAAIVSVVAAVTVVPLVSHLFLTPRYDYDGKHVVVTGGSSGIGLESAKLYAQRGANVTLVARDPIKLAAAVVAVAAYAKPGRAVNSASVDTSSSEVAVAAALAPALAAAGDVDVLVNCAGTSMAGTFDAADGGAAFERMLRINVLGSVYPTRAVLCGMKRRGGGRVVFVASQVAQAALHGYTAYAASKWALRGLAEALQMEVKPYGIYVSVCYPPDTDTPGYKEEMLTKPAVTKALSESGSVFSPAAVAHDILHYSALGYFGISTGLDGWLLKQLHPGMGPVNNWWEVAQAVLFAPLAKVISVFYVLAWDAVCRTHAHAAVTTPAGAAAAAAGTEKRTTRSGGSYSSSGKKAR